MDPGLASLMDPWLCRAADRGQAGGQRNVTERERRKEKGERNGSDLGSGLIEKWENHWRLHSYLLRVSVYTFIKVPGFLNVRRKNERVG